MGDTNYADGSVHTLTGGSSELNTVLGAAARRSQVGWHSRGRRAAARLGRCPPGRRRATAASPGACVPPTRHLVRCRHPRILLLGPQLVLVDYSASWCGPCRMMKPVLAALAGEHRGRLAVLVVDCEQARPGTQPLPARASPHSLYPPPCTACMHSCRKPVCGVQRGAGGLLARPVSPRAQLPPPPAQLA